MYALAAFSSYYFIEKGAFQRSAAHSVSRLLTVACPLVGRRKMFLVGSVGQCVSMLVYSQKLTFIP